MKPKIIYKMAIDFTMTVFILLLMAYNFTGDVVHEWLGTVQFVLFITHNILNFKWYQNLLKGRYPIFRILQTTINLLVVASMLGLMISGIMLSRHVFAFLSISSGMSFARRLHMFSAYWSLILMSLHLGLHWSMIMGVSRKMANIMPPSRACTSVLRAIAALISIYGVYAFVKHEIGAYLFLNTLYNLEDFGQSAVTFFIDYLAIMGLCVFTAYYATKLIRRYISLKMRKQHFGRRKSSEAMRLS